MNRVGEQTLMRYADGELGAIRSGEVERALAEDGRLRARLERDRRVRARLFAHYDDVANEPLPPRLAALAAPGSAPAGSPARTWWATAALAVALLLGWMFAARP